MNSEDREALICLLERNRRVDIDAFLDQVRHIRIQDEEATYAKLDLDLDHLTRTGDLPLDNGAGGRRGRSGRGRSRDRLERRPARSGRRSGRVTTG